MFSVRAPSAAIVLLFPGTLLHGQAVSLSAGHTSWTYFADQGGPTAALRFEVPIGSVLILEPGATWLRLANQGSSQPPHETHFVFELSVQAQLGIDGRVFPFLGAGAGLPTNVADDYFIAAHVVAGLRVRLTPAWYLRGEYRARDVGPIQ